MHKWKKFENLIAAIHKVLNAADYDVETDVKLSEASGAKHQVDVLLRPKTQFAGPILISCKAWSDPVGIEHVREWSDIVQQTGAASGVIVAQSGFTAGAIDAARAPQRRISLWIPRELVSADFSPDAGSPAGYMSCIQVRGNFRERRFSEETFTLDAVRADGTHEGRQVHFTFSAPTRDQWYLRDDADNVVGNLWDDFVARVQSTERSGSIEIRPPSVTILLLDGIRLRLRALNFAVEVIDHELSIEVDLKKEALAYENVVTHKVNIVPLMMLEMPVVPTHDR